VIKDRINDITANFILSKQFRSFESPRVPALPRGMSLPKSDHILLFRFKVFFPTSTLPKALIFASFQQSNTGIRATIALHFFKINESIVSFIYIKQKSPSQRSSKIKISKEQI